MDMDRLRELREKWSPFLDEVFAKKNFVQAVQINEEQLEELREFDAPLYEYTDLRTGSKVQTLWGLPVQIRVVEYPTVVMKSYYRMPFRGVGVTDENSTMRDVRDALSNAEDPGDYPYDEV